MARVLPASAEAIAEAGARLHRGELVAIPTETVYGLAGDATNERAIAAIYAAKARPRFNPLIVHYASAEDVRRDAVFDSRAERLAALWPGPLTLVLRRSESCHVPLLASAGLDTIAVRVPAHPAARAIILAARCPLAAPSANRSGAVSPTTAAHVAEELGDRIALIVDGGPCVIGLESTVVDLSESTAALLRPGGVPREAIEAAIGPVSLGGAGPAKSPGLIGRHYSPTAPLRLHAQSARPGEILLGFGADAPQDALNLSRAGDTAEAAANLYAMLRALDAKRPAAIAVMPIPESGLGAAINDRLRRAAERI